MARSFQTPVIIQPALANTSGLQLSKLLSGGQVTSGASPLGVDQSGNVVLVGGQVNTVTVDLGIVPVNAGTFTVSGSGLTVGTPVTCSLSGIFANGAYTDEYEMEPMAAFGMVASSTLLQFTVVCTDVQLLTVGKRTINYYLG